MLYAHFANSHYLPRALRIGMVTCRERKHGLNKRKVEQKKCPLSEWLKLHPLSAKGVIEALSGNANLLDIEPMQFEVVRPERDQNLAERSSSEPCGNILGETRKNSYQRHPRRVHEGEDPLRRVADVLGYLEPSHNMSCRWKIQRVVSIFTSSTVHGLDAISEIIGLDRSTAPVAEQCQ